MGAMASQITSLTIVYSTVYSGADQRKHQSSASLAFVRGIHWVLVNTPHKGPVTRKMFPFDDVIMKLHQFISRNDWKANHNRFIWILLMIYWEYIYQTSSWSSNIQSPWKLLGFCRTKDKFGLVQVIAFSLMAPNLPWYRHCLVCWSPSGARSQGISRKAIDVVHVDYSIAHFERVLLVT